MIFSIAAIQLKKLSTLFLTGLFTIITLVSSAQVTLPVSFNFQSATLPSWLTTDGTISTNGSVGSCNVCSAGRVVINFNGYVQVAVPAMSSFTITMKSSGASARTFTVSYKKLGQENFTDVGTVSAPQDGAQYDLVSLFPVLATTAAIEVKLVNSGSNGQAHIHDISIEGTPGSSGPSSAKDITAFTLVNAQIGASTINPTAGTVGVVVPSGTSLSNIVPQTFTISAAATINPLVSAPQDFSSPVNYTITAEDGSTKNWTIHTTIETPPAAGVDYEAELADFTGTVDNNHTGFSGTGFVNFLSNGENEITFTICQTSAGSQTATFTYAIGAAEARTARLFVNNDFVQDLTFTSTNTWTNWQQLAASVQLVAGINTIKLTWEETDGPNLDKLTLSGDACTRYTLNVTTTNGGNVSLSPSRKSNIYFNGETVTLLAEEKPALKFDNWTGDATGTANPTTLIMNGNKNVQANFTTIATYTLTVTTSGVGEVVLSPAGGVYPENTVVTLTANSVLGSTFSGWSGDAAGANNTTTVTMNGNKNVTATFSSVPALDFNTPVGFASTNTGATYPNFNGPVTGGQNALDTFWVNSPADFDALAWRLYYRNRAYKNNTTENGVPKAPLVIVFKSGVYPEGTSSSSAWGNHMMTIQEQGDLTIIGQGDVTLNFGFNIKRSWNILIRNITFQDYYDDGINIGEPETHHIWIDHCTVGHPTTMPANTEHPDGGIDTKAGASYITLSWNKIRNSWKTSLVGHSDSNQAEDEGKLKVTYYANHFVGTNSRNPRVRFGEVHVLNNLYEKIGLYGIAAAKDARVVAEGNFFVDTRWPMYADRTSADFKAIYGNNTDNVFTSKTGNLPAKYLKQYNNAFDDSGLPVITAQINSNMLNPGGRSIRFDELNPEQAFNPTTYYNYTPFPASVVRTIIPLFAGAGKVDFFNTNSGPGIVVNEALTHFTQEEGTPSTAQTYLVSGTDLTGNITITAPANYELSVDGTNWQTSANPITLAPSAGVLAPTTISVRLNANAVGTQNGNIIHSSNGVADVVVAITGATVASNGNWTVYQMSDLPLDYSSSFQASQQSGTFSSTLVPDPETTCANKFLEMSTAENGNNNQWRFNLPAGTTDLTVVFKAKTISSTANLVFDADLDFGGSRWNTRILTNGNFGIANGSAATGSTSLGVTANEWNIYRFVKKGTTTALYVNESNTPVYEGTAATSGSNNYFRFGDGWGSGFIQTQFDWMVWDVTGGYSPSEAALPTAVTAGCPVSANPTITVVGNLSPFTQELGTPSVAQTFTVSGMDLTQNLVLTAPAEYEISLDGSLWRNATQPLEISPTNGEISTTTIFVRLNAATAGTHAGTISIASVGATTHTLSVSGETTNPTPAGNWVEYHMNDLPLDFSSPFVVSQQSGTFSSTLVNDTNSPCTNSVLKMETDVNASNNQWRQNLPAGTNDLTLIIKAKTISSTANLVFDADLDFGGSRWNTRILTNGNFGIANGSAATGSTVLGVTANEWNIYRFVKKGTTTALYVNEGNTPVYEGTAASGGSNNYFRFGDGWGSGFIQTQFDWIIWDATGGYSPIEMALPTTVTAPCTPTITITGDLVAFAQTVGAPSASQTYSVSGTSLTAPLIITPPANFELSSDGTTWHANASPLSIAPTAGNITNTAISVRMNASAAGNFNGNINHSSTGTLAKTIAVVGTVTTGPTITVVSNLTSFNQTIGSPSSVQTYKVSGASLTNDISIHFPANYELSIDGGQNWLTNAAPIVLTQIAGVVSETTISVRLNASTTGTHNGNIIHSSTGAMDKQIALVGETVPPPPPTITVAGTLTAFQQELGTTSAVQTYTVSGQHLLADITITPSVYFEVSSDNGANWYNATNPLVIAHTNGAIATITISVRLNANSVGTHSGDIVHSTTDATSQIIAVTGSTFTIPKLTVNGAMDAFVQIIGTTSAVQSYTVRGENLQDNVILTPPVGYEISANGGANWFTNTNPLTLTPTAATLATTTISVRLQAANLGAQNGNIVHSTVNGESKNIAVTGQTVNIPIQSVSVNLMPFVQTLGSPSPAQVITISGSYLLSGVVVTAPVAYEVSLNNIDWASSVTVTTTGTLNNAPVRIRLNANAVGTHAGNITLSTTGAIGAQIGVTGSTTAPITIAPNPTQDVLRVFHKNLFTPGDITIYNRNGQLVLKIKSTPGSGNTAIDVSKLAAGAYSLEFRRGEETFITQFVKL